MRNKVHFQMKRDSNFRFQTFLAVLESKYSGGGSLDIDGVTEAIDDLYQTYVEDVVKKVCITPMHLYFNFFKLLLLCKQNFCSGLLNEKRLSFTYSQIFLVCTAARGA